MHEHFLLFDYRLSVIKRIFIFILITMRFNVRKHTILTNQQQQIQQPQSMSSKTRTNFTTITRRVATFLVALSLLNSNSSAIFMNDAVLDASTPCYDVDGASINAFVASNFGIETMNNETNENAKGLENRKHNESNNTIDDDLLAMTIVENTTTKSLMTIPKHVDAVRILSRSKRFLTFPEGSSFSVAVCFTVGIIGNPRFNYMAYGLNWGVAYDLPNTSWVINHLHGFSRHPVPATVLRRRTRRALYKEIELVVDNMGYNGRDCVLRALCESRQYFSKIKLSMIGEMMRVIFSLPKQRIFTRELRDNSEIEIYDRAYRHARDVSCAAQYDCSFSLLELAFGKYSTPPPGYYQ